MQYLRERRDLDTRVWLQNLYLKRLHGDSSKNCILVLYCVSKDIGYNVETASSSLTYGTEVVCSDSITEPLSFEKAGEFIE
jgi:hypothetical protein